MLCILGTKVEADPPFTTKRHKTAEIIINNHWTVEHRHWYNPKWVHLCWPKSDYLRAEKMRAVLYSNLLEKSENKINRSSRPEVFCKKGVLRNFAKFTGKHLCNSLFFNKVAGLRPATLLRNRPWHKYFSVNLAKFLRTPFLTEHLPWLLFSETQIF